MVNCEIVGEGLKLEKFVERKSGHENPWNSWGRGGEGRERLGRD